MTRRLAIGLTLAATVLGTGCTTFSDSGVAVRVNDVEYTHDDMDDLLDAINVPEVSQTDLDAIRSIAGTLVLAGSLGDYLAGLGVDVTDDDIAVATEGLTSELPTFADASADTQAALALAQANLTVASQQPDGAELQFEALQAAEVYVDPRIGTYDAATGTIVPLG